MPWALGDVDLGGNLLEVGPGPGLTTDVLRWRTHRLTSVEIDTQLARSLGERTRPSDATGGSGRRVAVVAGDGTRLPFADESFTGAVCLTMLHHVPSADLQNLLLQEVRRVLRPGAPFVGSDSMPSLLFKMVHLYDTMVLVDPATFGTRLERAGFRDVSRRVSIQGDA
jgi:SAM-dependent methyltransferase